MPYILLSGKRGKGKRAKVDEDTLKSYGHLSWFLSDTGYAMRRPTLDDGSKVTVRLHRLVAEAPEGMVVDHLNGDKLDNRRDNLRVCSQADNARNRKTVTGVSFDKSRKKWMVRYRNTFYGRHPTRSDALRAYQLACSGIPYEKQRRKYWHLPTGVSKQFGKYRVCPQRDGKKYCLGQYNTAEEAQEALNKWKKERIATSQALRRVG